MTPHIECEKNDIAKKVIMPGDPLRAKRIADKYLTNVRQVNFVRNMFGYTGLYKGEEVTVFASGMGIPSIGIYAYELFKFYDVEEIIRVGSCGSLNENVKVFDVVMAKSASSASNFALLFSEDTNKTFDANIELNEIIEETAKKNNISLKIGDIVTSDVFDVYVDYDKFIKHFPKKDYYASEMESFALFYLAKLLNKKASCLLTVVDSKYEKDKYISAEDRQNSLDKMIYLSLESIINKNN